MNPIKQAEIKFNRLGFQVYEYIPYKPPINDLKEIDELKKKIESPSIDIKSKALLEHLLHEQEIGQEESLHTSKTFKIFMSLPGERRPYIHGSFIPKDNLYSLSFLSRNMKSEEHPLRNAGKLSFNFIPTEDSTLSNTLTAYLNNHRQNFGFPEEVSFVRPGICNIEMTSPYVIQTEDTDLNRAYINLSTAIRALGYDMQEL